MRLALLIFMIALLPLRGWAASAMMVEHGTLMNASTTIAGSAYRIWDAARFDTKLSHQGTDCPHAAVPATTTTDQPQNSHSNGSTHTDSACASCGLCHLSTAVFTQAATPETTLPAAMPAQPVSRFASVTTLPGLKPPIA